MSKPTKFGMGAGAGGREAAMAMPVMERATPSRAARTARKEVAAHHGVSGRDGGVGGSAVGVAMPGLRVVRGDGGGAGGMWR